MLFCFEDVKKFQTKFSVPMPDHQSVLNDEAYNFRVGFLREEQKEFVDSHFKKDFEGCIDALLDEVYVACGTSLMMGVDEIAWGEAYNYVLDNEKSTSILDAGKLPKSGQLSFLTDEEYNKAVSLLELNLNNFIHFHYYGKIEGSTNAMAAIVSTCYSIAYHMGIDWATWRELWDDVQRANMTKVRATSASQSKRKTSLDVIKPEGWVGPNGGKILDNRYPEWRTKL